LNVSKRNFAVLKFRDENILRGFAERLVEVRKKKGITQEDLAYASGLSLSQIARIETSRINPTLCTIVVIARTLKIHPKELLDFQVDYLKE
jgi:transcriptional regulator with XRE-family HTH domain